MSSSSSFCPPYSPVHPYLLPLSSSPTLAVEPSSASSPLPLSLSFSSLLVLVRRSPLPSSLFHPGGGPSLFASHKRRRVSPWFIHIPTMRRSLRVRRLSSSSSVPFQPSLLFDRALREPPSPPRHLRARPRRRHHHSAPPHGRPWHFVAALLRHSIPAQVLPLPPGRKHTLVKARTSQSASPLVPKSLLRLPDSPDRGASMDAPHPSPLPRRTRCRPLSSFVPRTNPGHAPPPCSWITRIAPIQKPIGSGSRMTASGHCCFGNVPHSTVGRGPSGERTVKRLCLSKALTIPEKTTVLEACQRMVARGVDAVLLTDSDALLCGILTDKDITTRVISRELNPEETPVYNVMTRNPVFVLSDTLAADALQKMVQGKFRHLPVVEKGEVIALLEIAKCLYDAIARMERAVEKGKAISAAVEGVERDWGTSTSGCNTFIETLREQMFRPSLSTIITENPKVVIVSPTDSVLTATKKMLELGLNSAIIMVNNKPCGILTSRDIVMRVIVQNHPPESTPVEKVMTPNPECGTIDTPIVDALHTMHNGNFLHLPVLDRGGNIVVVIDVIHIIHAAVATIGSTGATGNEATNSMMQKFWDSAMALGPVDNDDDIFSEGSTRLASDGAEAGRPTSYPSSGLADTFSFKLEDKKGRKHRFKCETRSLTDLITCILQRVGNDINWNRPPQIMYEDEDQDKVVLASDSDLAAAVGHARLAGWKGLRLYLDYSGGEQGSLDWERTHAWATAYSAVAAGAALVAGLGVLAFLKRSTS